MLVRRRRTVRWIIDGEHSYVRSRLICERLGHQNMHCARRCRQTLRVRAGHKWEKGAGEYGGKDELLHETTSLSIAGRWSRPTARHPWRPARPAASWKIRFFAFARFLFASARARACWEIS